MSDLVSLGYFIAEMGIIAIIILLLILVVYFIGVVGNIRVLEYYNHPNVWMAFIPIISTVALIQCVKEDYNGNILIFNKPIAKKHFIWAPILVVVLGFVPVLGSLLSTVLNIICLTYVYRDLLSRACREDMTIVSLISAFIPIVWVVMCYINFSGKVSNVEYKL